MYTLIIDGMNEDSFDTFEELLEAAKELRILYPDKHFQYIHEED